MPPKAKRAAESTWQQGDRVRAALAAANTALAQLAAAMDAVPNGTRFEITTATIDAICAQTEALPARLGAVCRPVDVPALPADCWNIVMEFVLDRRTMATVGPGGVVNEPREWWPQRSEAANAQLRALRLVSRTWCRLASELVRAIVLDNGTSKRIRHPTTLANTFPNARYIKARSPQCDYIEYVNQIAADLERNATRLHGPLSIESFRVSRVIWPTYNTYRRIIGKNDTIYKYVGNISSKCLRTALATADVVFVGIINNQEKMDPAIMPTLRAKLILLDMHLIVSQNPLLQVLAAFDADSRSKTHIFTSVLMSKADRQRYDDLGIQYSPTPLTDKKTQGLIKKRICSIGWLFN